MQLPTNTYFHVFLTHMLSWRPCFATIFFQNSSNSSWVKLAYSVVLKFVKKFGFLHIITCTFIQVSCPKMMCRIWKHLVYHLPHCSITISHNWFCFLWCIASKKATRKKLILCPSSLICQQRTTKNIDMRTVITSQENHQWLIASILFVSRIKGKDVTKTLEIWSATSIS